VVVYDDVGFSWNLAEEAARKFGKELLDQHPRAIRREEKIRRFFEFKPRLRLSLTQPIKGGVELVYCPAKGEPHGTSDI
jgi:hypothetical protein